MPLARISHPAEKSNEYIRALSSGVHNAMIEAFAIPHEDYFQILTEHVPEKGLRFPKSFLGIDHGDEIVIIQITAAEGRSTDQKKALYRAIVRELAQEPGLPKEDIIINLIETKRENWSFGNGEAPFA